MDSRQSLNPFDQILDRLTRIEEALTLLSLEGNSKADLKFYTIKEAANLLNVAAITMYRNVKAGKIPSKKIGQRVMIPSSYLQ